MTNIGWKLQNSYAQLPPIFYKKMKPTPVKSPKLIILNHSVAQSLGLHPERLQTDEAVQLLSGNNLPEESEPLAQAYAGHQFGHFNMLGDGRAILLGEQKTPSGQTVDIQLKGAGWTPYSRGGDGRAALGPMLREYIMSEAMHALGIPTTRSLAVVTTGEDIARNAYLPGAVLTRVADSHLRVGTFQFANQFGTVDELRALADYSIARHYPEIADKENTYLLFLKQVIQQQAILIAKWQLVGFIHGVMNTDNMTISGETIDYGPCAFMDTYDQATVFSSIDVKGRYAYGNQPYIGVWNITRFAEALLPLLHENQEEAIIMAEGVLSDFAKIFKANWYDGMRGKLGICNIEAEDETLIDELLEMMQAYKVDYTNTFRAFTLNHLEDSKLYEKEDFQQWLRKWQARLERQEETKEAVALVMKKNNPAVIPRNHRVEEALEAAMNGDLQVIEKLLQVLKNPYAYTKDQEAYSKLPDLDQPYVTYCGT